MKNDLNPRTSFLNAAILLLPLVLVCFVKQQSKSIYSVAYIAEPFAAGSLVVECLPDSIAIQRVRNLKTRGISFQRIPASHPALPKLRHESPERTNDGRLTLIARSLSHPSIGGRGTDAPYLVW